MKLKYCVLRPNQITYLLLLRQYQCVGNKTSVVTKPQLTFGLLLPRISNS